MDVNVAMSRVLPATVLIVDDDTTLLNRFAKEAHRSTNLGLLSAGDLQSAAEIIESGIPIAAVLTDLHFRSEFQDDSRDLHDGLDFLKYYEERNQGVPLYVMSMDADDRFFRNRAEKEGVSVRAWYDKLQDLPREKKPWAAIERDLIVQALKRDANFRDDAEKHGIAADLLVDESIAEKVRTMFNFPRRTYLQDMHLRTNAHARFVAPLEVNCWPEQGDVFVARAVKVPLMLDGHGDDIVEAMADLGDRLLDEWDHLRSVEPSKLEGYAKWIFEQLNSTFEARK